MQDMIEGNWCKCETTNAITSLYGMNLVLNKATNIIESDNNITKEDKEKVIYTIIVLFYINDREEEKASIAKLIIKKGKKYLSKKGINYNAFIKKFRY